MPFPEDPLVEIVLPETPVAGNPSIYLGTRDSLLSLLTLDEGMVFHFGPNGDGYVIGIQQQSGGTDGQLSFYGVKADNTFQGKIIGADFDVSNNILSVSMGDPSGVTGMQGKSIRLYAGIGGNLFYGYSELGHRLGDPSDLNPFSTTAVGTLQANKDLLVQGIDIGGGVVLTDVLASTTAAIGTSETVYWTLPSFTYKAGRAYVVNLMAQAFTNTAGTAFKSMCRKSNVSGLSIRNLSWTPAVSSTTAYNIQGGTFPFIVGAADVTAALCFSIQAGTGTVQVSGGSMVEIRDVGTANNYSRSGAITIPTLV
jgi:hypothetical protein